MAAARRTNGRSVDAQLAELQSHYTSLERAQGELRADLATLSGVVRHGFDEIRSDLSRATRPDLRSFAQWAGVVISFVLAIGTPIGLMLMTRLGDNDRRLVTIEHELDDRGKMLGRMDATLHRIDTEQQRRSRDVRSVQALAERIKAVERTAFGGKTK